jgi:hypothetical protein
MSGNEGEAARAASGCGVEVKDPCWLAVPDAGFSAQPLPTNANAFTAWVSVVPSTLGLDGIVGMAAGVPTTPDDLAVAIRFNADGSLEARNGDAFAAANALHYGTETAFRVTFLVDAIGGAYSAWISGRLIAENYAFHVAPGAALDHLSTAVTSDAGALRACDFGASADERMTWLHHAAPDDATGTSRSMTGLANGELLVTSRAGTELVDARGELTTTFEPGGSAIALDGAENRYLFGEFSGSSAPGGDRLASVVGTDVFVSKYDSSFNHVYTRSLGGTADATLTAFDVNASGNVAVLVGSTLSRFDDEGRLSFQRAVDGQAAALALDGAGSVYVAANTSEPSNSAPSPTVTKLDASGAPVWTRTAVSHDGGAANALALRAAPTGGVVLSGSLAGSVDFGGALLEVTRGDGAQTFVAWLDGAGEYEDGIVVELVPNAGLGVDASGTVTLGGYRPDPDTFLLERFAFDGSRIAGVTELGGHELTQGLFLGTASAPSVDAAGNVYWSVSARMLPEQSAELLLKLRP